MFFSIFSLKAFVCELHCNKLVKSNSVKKFKIECDFLEFTFQYLRSKSLHSLFELSLSFLLLFIRPDRFLRS